MSKSNLSVQSIGAALANALSTKRGQNQSNKKPKRATRNKMRIRSARNSGTNAWSRSLPASYANHVRPSFRVLNRSANSMRVAGCDLVYPLPTQVLSVNADSDEFLFTVIPVNPAYWTGTRVAQMAPAYMNYRPIQLTFHYIPQVAVTQPGSVIFGTLWNGAAPSTDIQQALNTSNGGGIINCYVPASTRISLGSNLQQNLFTLSGSINPNTSPFIFTALARGCVDSAGHYVTPGYFMVDYVYEFKNAIGQTWLYDRTLPQAFSTTQFSLPNSSIVLLDGFGAFGPGTVMDVESVSGSPVVYYQGTTVTVPPDKWVMSFQNGQSASIQALARQVQELSAVPNVTDSSVALYYRPNGADGEPPYAAIQHRDGTYIFYTDAARFTGTTKPYWRVGSASPILWSGQLSLTLSDGTIMTINYSDSDDTHAVIPDRLISLPEESFPEF